jgi:hypothetical protein
MRQAASYKLTDLSRACQGACHVSLGKSVYIDVYNIVCNAGRRPFLITVIAFRMIAPLSNSLCLSMPPAGLSARAGSGA